MWWSSMFNAAAFTRIETRLAPCFVFCPIWAIAPCDCSTERGCRLSGDNIMLTLGKQRRFVTCSLNNVTHMNRYFSTKYIMTNKKKRKNEPKLQLFGQRTWHGTQQMTLHQIGTILEWHDIRKVLLNLLYITVLIKILKQWMTKMNPYIDCFMTVNIPVTYVTLDEVANYVMQPHVTIHFKFLKKMFHSVYLQEVDCSGC